MWYPNAKFDAVVVVMFLVIWVSAPVNHPRWNCLTTDSFLPGMMVSMSTHYLLSWHHKSCLKFEVHRDGNFY